MCKAIREGDEMACSCGLRWGLGEEDPHNAVTPEPAEPEHDTSVVNGHTLFKASDFTDEELELNHIAHAVAEGEIQICRNCGAIEDELSEACAHEKR